MGLSAGHRSPRRFAFVLACCVAVFLTAFSVTQQAARAQDQPPPAAGDQGAAPAHPPAEEHLIVFMIRSVGWVMGTIIMVLSMSLLFIIVLLIMDLRMSDAVPPAFVEEFTETVNKRRFKEAFELAKQDSSYLGRVLAVGMARLQYGIEDAREAAMNTVESIKAHKEQLITYLATIGTLGPLFGLVGTVFSMIGAFKAMADPSKATDPHGMAGVLSHGLVVTLLGIALAVPAIFCHAFFRNRLTKLSMETANVADDLLTQMYHNSRRPAATPTAAPAPEANARPAPAAAVKPAD
jgi:biopolymer transport protein ExbB